MRGLWNFLNDPGLHVLAILLALMGLAIGSSGTADPSPATALSRCQRCRNYHLPTRACLFASPGPRLQALRARP